jgi:hypothetical protein
MVQEQQPGSKTEEAIYLPDGQEVGSLFGPLQKNILRVLYDTCEEKPIILQDLAKSICPAGKNISIIKQHIGSTLCRVRFRSKLKTCGWKITHREIQVAGGYSQFAYYLAPLEDKTSDS